MSDDKHDDERGNGNGPGNGGPGHGGGHGNDDRTITIKIDRETYKVDKKHMTGRELRLLPRPPVGPERDLFQVVPGGSDKKIEDSETVELNDGMRFFTAPAQINPGYGA